MNNSVILLRLIGMSVACLAVPPVLCRYLGPALGALGASGAAVFWYSQYRIPVPKEQSGPYFWFVAGGYGFIGITLVVCLGRLMGVRLL